MAVVDATVNGFSVGYRWAAGALGAGPVLTGVRIRGGTRFHPGVRRALDEIVGGLI